MFLIVLLSVVFVNICGYQASSDNSLTPKIGPLGIHLDALASDANANQKIERLKALESDLLPFVVKRLAKEKKISIAEAEEARVAFLKYMSLDILSPEAVAYPNDKADSFWHEFLMFTIPYKQWCHKHFGKFIDHVPFDDEDEDAHDMKLEGHCGSACGGKKEDKAVPSSCGSGCGAGCGAHKKALEAETKTDDKSVPAHCGSACGAKKDDKSVPAHCGSACGAKKDDKSVPAHCGSACGAKKDDKAVPAHCGSACGAKKEDKAVPSSCGAGCGAGCGAHKKAIEGEKSAGCGNCGPGKCSAKRITDLEVDKNAPTAGCGNCSAGEHKTTKEEKLKNWQNTVDLMKRLYGDNWGNV